MGWSLSVAKVCGYLVCPTLRFVAMSVVLQCEATFESRYPVSSDVVRTVKVIEYIVEVAAALLGSARTAARCLVRRLAGYKVLTADRCGSMHAIVWPGHPLRVRNLSM